MGKLVELTLNGGINPMTGVGLLPTGCSLRQFESYEALYAALKEQLRAHLRVIPQLDSACALSYDRLVPTPFLSAVMDDSVALCADVSGAGRHSYDNTIIEFQGLITAANSLAALRLLVFDAKRIDATELEAALRENFAGQHGSEIRAALLEAPKYGNDDDYVDEIAGDLLTFCLDEIEQYQASTGGHFGGSLLSITATVPLGKVTGATPDGRYAWEPLADNISPQKGTALRGPTAVLRSAAKLDHARLINGSVLNLTMHPFAVNTNDGLVKFVNLIRGYCDEGGYQVQFNVHSADTLRKAQQHPDEYRDLVVKVSGYSARFVELDPIVQEEIVVRLENML
jgi:formate C-acetyltransferase